MSFLCESFNVVAKHNILHTSGTHLEKDISLFSHLPKVEIRHAIDSCQVQITMSSCSALTFPSEIPWRWTSIDFPDALHDTRHKDYMKSETHSVTAFTPDIIMICVWISYHVKENIWCTASGVQTNHPENNCRCFSVVISQAETFGYILQKYKSSNPQWGVLGAVRLKRLTM